MAKVTVIPGKCQGHARCYALAPDFFDLDDEGYIDFAEKDVPEGADQKLIRRGTNACPERALTYVDEA